MIGTRIREHRQMAGLRQADLARRIGISGSYLNLIEHNRRRIGGKLLMRIAGELDVEAALLSEGAEAALLATLGHSAAELAEAGAEIERAEDFAARFPGWARLIAIARRRMETLERRLEETQDRMQHDPALAASVHDVLSAVASIRSTASILAETETLHPAWRDRFHANINQDSARLAESSRALVGYLEADPAGDMPLPEPDPVAEISEFVAQRDNRFPPLERPAADVADYLAGLPLTAPAADLIAPYLDLYHADAVALPEGNLRAGLASCPAGEPLELARHLAQPVGRVLRRLATLPEIAAGLLLCLPEADLFLVKPLAGFSAERFGSAVPSLPLYKAMAQPGSVLSGDAGRLVAGRTFATAGPLDVGTFGAAPRHAAVMLILAE